MKIFVCCFLLCAAGLSQAQFEDSPEVAAAKAAHFEAVRRAELVIANAPPVINNQKRPEVPETTQHKLGLNVNDTPEVAAAKLAHYEAVREAEHATAVANATGKAPDSKPIVASSIPVQYSVEHAGPVLSQHATNIVPTTQHQLGVNVHDTPEVAAAKAIHNESVRRAQQIAGAVVSQDHGTPLYSYNSAPIIQTTQHQLGVNVHDTAEVVAAKSAHFEAVRRAEQAAVASGYSDDGSYVMVPRYQQMAPVVQVGHLRDTPEVTAAKAAHFEALRRAEMTAGPRYIEQYIPMAHQVMYVPMPHHQSINYNRMIPVIAVPQTNQHKLGVNVHDTPEVAAAKAAHFKAFRQAQLAAENEPELPAGIIIPANNYFTNPTGQYSQVY